MKIFSAVAVATILATVGVTVPAQASTAGDPFQDPRFIVDYERFTDSHPTDFVGQARLTEKYGVTLESLSLPEAGMASISPEAAQRLVASKSHAGLPTKDAKQRFTATAADLGKYFSVSGRIYKVKKTKQTVVEGSWNFQNSFGGGLGPKDIAALEWRSCFNVKKTGWTIYDYKNRVHKGLGTIRSASPNGNTVLQIADKVNGGYLNYDHGHLRVYGSKSKKCKLQAAFQYEHNQGNSSSLSVSVGFGFLNVGYNGGGVAKAKKSTPIFS